MKQGCKCDVTAKTCTIETLTDREGIEWDRIPYALIRNGEETGSHCHDCGVAHGGFHHTGCDMEICPKCSGQRFICDCFESVVASKSTESGSAAKNLSGKRGETK